MALALVELDDLTGLLVEAFAEDYEDAERWRRREAQRAKQGTALAGAVGNLDQLAADLRDVLVE